MKDSEDIRSVIRSGSGWRWVCREGVGIKGVIGVPLRKAATVPKTTDQLSYDVNPLTYVSDNLTYTI